MGHFIGSIPAPQIDKRKFVIYDFFGNKAYFDDANTDDYKGGSGDAVPRIPSPLKSPRELIEQGLDDIWQIAVAYVEVGPEGERIDKKKYLHRWEETMRRAAATGDPPGLQKIRNDDVLTKEVERALAHALNQPSVYCNEQNLRHAYRNLGGTSDRLHPNCPWET